MDINQVITQFLVEYPILTKIVIIIGILRVIFKPLMTVLQDHVERTVSDSDNNWLKRFQASWYYVIIAFLLDFTASIKIPAKKDKKDE